jgi:hypothetical protein
MVGLYSSYRLMPLECSGNVRRADCAMERIHELLAAGLVVVTVQCYCIKHFCGKTTTSGFMTFASSEVKPRHNFRTFR